jgi:hypothetical protein
MPPHLKHPTPMLALTLALATVLLTITIAAGANQAPLALASVHDDFADPQYDGAFNPNLWAYASTPHVVVAQMDGSLVFSTTAVLEGGNAAITPLAPAGWTLEQARILEARFKLDGNRRGSFLNTALVVSPFGDSVWWAECQLGAAGDTETRYFCNIESGEFEENGTPIFEYTTDAVMGAYDTWYVTRMEADPATGKFKFYLDGQLIGQYLPEDAETIKTATFYPQVGSWVDASEQYVGYVDYVHIGVYPAYLPVVTK